MTGETTPGLKDDRMAFWYCERTRLFPNAFADIMTCWTGVMVQRGTLIIDARDIRSLERPRRARLIK